MRCLPSDSALERRDCCHTQQLGIFAKYWEPGQVKTRLAQSLEPQQAAQLYLIFLKHLLRRCSEFPYQKILAFSPNQRRCDFQDLLTNLSLDDWSLIPQCEGDLGDRMQHFFDTRLRQVDAEPQESPSVVLIGSDSPHLPKSYYEQAFEILQTGQQQVVLGALRRWGLLPNRHAFSRASFVSRYRLEHSASPLANAGEAKRTWHQLPPASCLARHRRTA